MMLVIILLLWSALLGHWVHGKSLTARSHKHKRDNCSTTATTEVSSVVGLADASASSTRHRWGQGQWLSMNTGTTFKGDGEVVAVAVETSAVAVTVHAAHASSTFTSTAPSTTSAAPMSEVVAVQEVDSTRAISAAAATSSTAVSSSDSSTQAWLDAHNVARANYGAGEVTWRDDLVRKAKANAELCTATHTNAGENIQWGSGTGTPQGAVDDWMSENSLYSWSNPVYSDATGHFTQVVWNATTQIGCYIATCAAGTVEPEKYGTGFQSTCEYYPAGNVVNSGEFAANVGQLVS